MQYPITDSLGRATFHHIAPHRDVRPTEREIRWLQHIERHGPQSSEMLYELTRETHRCKDTSLRRMQTLRAGGFLMLPRQQRATERAEFNPYVYDLTKQAKDHLTGLGMAQSTLRPTGHWWHQYMTSAFTGSLDIMAQRVGRTFIPGHQILRRSCAELAIPVGTSRVIPDQLFAIRYGDGFRAFLLEIDRGTEPKRSTQARKNLIRSVDLYVEMFAKGLHQKHYDLKANTLALWVFTNPVDRTAFVELVRSRAGRYQVHFLSKLMPVKTTWANLETLHGAPWTSVDGRRVEGL